MTVLLWFDLSYNLTGLRKLINVNSIKLLVCGPALIRSKIACLPEEGKPAYKEAGNGEEDQKRDASSLAPGVPEKLHHLFLAGLVLQNARCQKLSAVAHWRYVGDHLDHEVHAFAGVGK